MSRLVLTWVPCLEVEHGRGLTHDALHFAVAVMYWSRVVSCRVSASSEISRVLRRAYPKTCGVPCRPPLSEP
jgi:hypothetical protein